MNGLSSAQRLARDISGYDAGYKRLARCMPGYYRCIDKESRLDYLREYAHAWLDEYLSDADIGAVHLLLEMLDDPTCSPNECARFYATI